MPTDYTQKEREFLESLEANTGKNLTAWLTAISAQGLEDRNAIIDWLRKHGLTSSNASWLERIYHNGGRPIYEQENANQQKQSDPSNVEQQSLSRPQASDLQPPSPQPSLNARGAEREHYTFENTVPIQDAPSDQVLAVVLARAKGLRPLAVHVLRKVNQVAPKTLVSKTGNGLVFAVNDTIYGGLDMTPSALKLGLIVAGADVLPPFAVPHVSKTTSVTLRRATHMLVFDDVRQVNDVVLATISDAANSA